MTNFGLIRGMRGAMRGRGRGRAARGSAAGAGQIRNNVSASFGKTLQFITEIKLAELEKQRLAYMEHSAVLQKAAALTNDLPGRVELLLNAVRSWRGSGAVNYHTILAGKLDLASIDLWLLQARKDPGFSPEVVRDWADTLEAHIRHSITRFEFAKLFGGLFNEWLASGDSVTAKSSSLDASPATDTTAEAFVEVGRKEMYEQQERFKSLIFQTKNIDTAALTDYLSALFVGPSIEILDKMREGMLEFAQELEKKTITADDMTWIIKSLLASDQMAESKRQTIREFAQNPTVLSEIATVMNMRLANLEAWTWPTQGAQVDMRRHLNGKYRFFTDPDVLDALFLHYIGIMWQVKFKQDATELFSSKAWKQEFQPFTHAQTQSRSSFFGEHANNASIHSHRQTLRKDHFLLGQLASSVESTPVYDEDGIADQTQIPASHVKQELLHLVATESYLNRTLHDTFTVVATDFEWFGPSLSFDTISTCLAFFGVPDKWLQFFRRFLEMPLYFKEDKPGEGTRIRQCGTPLSYSLSAFFGEVVLFGLDYAVNQRAGGLFLHRIHDDVWLWNADSNKCVQAWAEIQNYSSLAGLTINQKKTGAVCVGASVAPELPVGDIRWGFLKFNAEQGRFIIDQAEVDVHIVELRRQLAATKSAFGWINCWNRYAAFLSRNFGARPTKSFGPALCLGQAHLDDMIDTLARIQRELFHSESGFGAVNHLRAVIEQRFGVTDLPDGYFYFPISSGGLELRNPLIELLAVRDAFIQDPAGQFLAQMKADQEAYDTLQESWAEKPTYSSYPIGKAFPPFAEYASYRETGLRSWQVRYQSLMNTAHPTQLTIPNGLQTPRANQMDFYDRWVLAMYGDQILKKFGSLEPVDADLIPVGLVHLFSGSRHQWDQ
ncbi:hypothetical protein MIND_00723800 [Mycena indigotica]|uniref:Reverse transcriptase domain-containing protein n=1 Tax=Mycena indigotica TaxID=2126181 RepID=A0A8H6SM65_9AGAR|nr:uncharacterized protein MIND_00723800 [Mycena indigotica]KAF7301583.1 hypothetical protein MIND_00723800 [Mycena indigotica]